MVQLELPHINVLTKCDLVDEKELTKYDYLLLLYTTTLGCLRLLCCAQILGSVFRIPLGEPCELD